MRPVWICLASLVLLLPGCGQDDAPARSTGEQSGHTSTAGSATATAAPSVVTSALVGEWERFQKCPELVGALRQAGLENTVPTMLAEDGWIPGVTSPEQIADPEHPCRGAVARKHSHFFTEDGVFGSHDANGELVDDGVYELLDEDTFRIGDVTFHFTITGGDTIAFEPEIPACAPDCFEAQWSVAVAYPGYTWHRVR